MKKIILGIQVTNRLTKAPEVEKLFTQYGCNIKTRLGLHDVNETSFSPTGLASWRCSARRRKSSAWKRT